MTKAQQTAREDNIRAIVSYFKSGIKTKADGLGIELEHTLTHRNGAPVSYSEDHGVAWLLEQLQQEYPQVTRDGANDIVGVATENAAVTIEPAAQVELSAGPFTSLAAARAQFEQFEANLAAILAPHEIDVKTTGYHPSAQAGELELIPKRRYELMNRYLGAISPFGVRMMRGSASTQVSIDYTSVDDCLRKLRIAFALVPALSLICDNSPRFEGAKRPHELMRTEIWRHCDPDRCGIVSGVMNESFSLESYAEYILDTPAILTPDGEGGWRDEPRTFGEVYAERTMTASDVEHALSMFFTDVRLKTYIEIRPADAMPIPYVIAYAALIKGLFYSEQSLHALESEFGQVNETNIEAAKTSLMARGYHGEIYGKPAPLVVDSIMAIARKALGADATYLEPLEKLTSARTTLATLAE